MTHSCYLERVMSHTKRGTTIHWCIDAILNGPPLPSSCGLVFSGISGTLIGVAVAEALDLPFGIVRKPGDCNDSHGIKVERSAPFSYYIFLDDLIESGNTFTHALSVMSEQTTAKCCGVLTYERACDEIHAFFHDYAHHFTSHLFYISNH